MAPAAAPPARAPAAVRGYLVHAYTASGVGCGWLALVAAFDGDARASLLWLVAATLLASALGFARRDAKTGDHLFTGFPSYWNIVAVYLIALRPAPWTAAAILLGLAVLVFVPIRYVYPSRTVFLRPLTLVLGAIWTVAFVAIIAQLPAPSAALVWGSLAYPLYYLALSLWLTVRRVSA